MDTPNHLGLEGGNETITLFQTFFLPSVSFWGIPLMSNMNEFFSSNAPRGYFFHDGNIRVFKIEAGVVAFFLVHRQCYTFSS